MEQTELNTFLNSYPEYLNNYAKVIVHCTTGTTSKAMFYWNGKKPTFSSYGTDITQEVISWEYADE